MSTTSKRWRRFPIVVASLAALWGAATPVVAQQRVLGVDISYWNRGSSGISQAAWDTAYNTPNANGFTRQFAFIRATRGGTTGLDQPQGTPGGGTSSTLSRRYDDSEFMRNITRAAKSGMFAGAYHYGRPDIAGNTGTDEANHFIQMAGPWMRPGYLMPVFDLEAGGGGPLAQFSLDFSNRIYSVMGIRPAIYINGNYTNHLVNSSTPAQRDAIAKPVGSGPSVVGPAYPMLWNARYYDQEAPGFNPETIPVQTGSPRTHPSTNTSYYGPWDDYGDSAPWSFWQYASVVSVPGINAHDSTIDGNVSQGDIEYVKNYLVPAVWWNNSSGNWGTLTNWNSGQPTSTPVPGSGQAAAASGGTVPVPRLPGTAGSGPASTSGIHDTVILERPAANITVTHSSGTTNIRKLYMRETLDITGGSFTINYDPTYRPDTSSLVKHGGPISAQFSGPVTLSGTGSLSVHTLQVDAAQTFTLAGSTGTLTFNTINLMSGVTPAKIAVTGNVNINPLSNATATIAGSSGSIDLGGENRTFNVGNGSSALDLSINVPITNGGLTKTGLGTMNLGTGGTFTGSLTINSGTFRYGNTAGLGSASVVTVNNGGTLDMNNVNDTFAALASAAGNTTGFVTRGTANLTLNAASGSNTFDGTITGTGNFTKNGGSTQILSGNNSFGAVTVGNGSLILHGTNTTGAVTVNNGATLGGAGSISGPVTVNAGGHLAPGASAGTFTAAGGLTLQTGSILDFQVMAIGSSTFSDVINVTPAGGLTINGGTINVTNLGGMIDGSYTLIDYAETFNGSLSSLSFGTMPEGFEYDLVDTGSMINLVVSSGVSGDYNADGTVDAADYVVWRHSQSASTPMPNDPTPETVDEDDYGTWAANFGKTFLPGGGGAAGGANSAVPEPSSAWLGLIGLAAGLYIGARRRKQPAVAVSRIA